MKLVKGDMWIAFPGADLFCITTNAMVRKDGALVMGRGIAAQAKARFPRLPYDAGALLHDRGLVEGRYGLLVPYHDERLLRALALFQVKLHWADEADPELIRFSCMVLSDYVREECLEDVHLNFPGIGNGRLRREDVFPLLEPLPDSVTVWEFA